MSNKVVYRVFKAAGLLQKRRVREAALYQAARLFELLPSKPNELWQADVTYLHIPGHGWWYAVTVIDYYSRYLLRGDVGQRLRELVKQMCSGMGVEILSGVVARDHVHMLVSVPPQVSVSKLAAAGICGAAQAILGSADVGAGLLCV